MSFIQRSICESLEEEEEYQHKRLGEDWLLKDEENISKSEDNIITCMLTLLIMLLNINYNQLFGPAEGFCCRLRNDGNDVWAHHEILFDVVSDDLTKPFYEEEVMKVIDGMERNNVAGCDGFPMEFYQASFPLIKDDLMTC